MKITVGIIIGFAVGLLAHLIISNKPDAERHWEAVNKYNAFVENASNYKPDAQTGLSVTTPPADPLPSLAALVGLGELAHVDLVFPSVPNSSEVTRQWMAFVQQHNEIIYVTGNPTYEEIKPSGTQPLHLNIWFRETNQAVVQKLILELEAREQERK